MNSSILEWMEETAGRFPNKTAIIDANGSITYAEYHQKALAIARSIIKLSDSTRKIPVVVYLEKGKEVLTSFIGIAYKRNGS